MNKNSPFKDLLNSIDGISPRRRLHKDKSNLNTFSRNTIEVTDSIDTQSIIMRKINGREKNFSTVDQYMSCESILPDIVNQKYTQNEMSNYLRSPISSRKAQLHRIRVIRDLRKSKNDLSESPEQKHNWNRLLDIVGD